MKLYKLVVRDKNGKVKQIHELSMSNYLILDIIEKETSKGYTVSITELSN